MVASEHVLVRMGVAGRLLFLAFALALLAFALFWITFTVTLRCERVAERDLYCTSHSHSSFHDSEETIEARDVREVKTVMHVYGSRRSRQRSMLAVYAIGDTEQVHIPIGNSAFLFPETRRGIATELDAFVNLPDGAAPYSRVVAVEPVLRAILASLTLLFPLALWGALRNTLVAVDRRAGTVTISRRLLGISTSSVVVSLDRAVTVLGKPRYRGQDLFLQLTRGEPVHIVWVPRRRAAADFAALKRLFPLDGFRG